MFVHNVGYSVPLSILIWDATIKLHSFVGMIFFSKLKCTSAHDKSDNRFISIMVLQTSICIVKRVCVVLSTSEGDERHCLC